MSYLLRTFAIPMLFVTLFGCSSGGDEHAHIALSPDIEGFMGFYWGDGTDVLLDHSMYEVNTTPAGEVFSYIGDPYYFEDFDVMISDERYEFVDGRLAAGEFVGDNIDDMEKLRVRLVEKYGEPGESSLGHYKWVSAAGTIVLDDVEDYWSMMGWSADAPDYWQ